MWKAGGWVLQLHGNHVWLTTSHTKKKIPTCHIVKHFINDCPDKSLCNIKFILVDVVNNVQDLTQKEIDDLLLKKEKFWIGTLVMQHKGLNGTHDWIRNNRCDREKFTELKPS